MTDSCVIPGGGTCPMQPEHKAVEVSHQFPTIYTMAIIVINLIHWYSLNCPGKNLLLTLKVTVKALGDHLAVRG